MCLACCFVIIIVDDDKQAAGPTESIYVHPFRGLVGCQTQEIEEEDDQMNRLEVRAQFIKFGGLFFFAQDYRETIIVGVLRMNRVASSS